MTQFKQFHWYLIEAQLPPRLAQVQAHLIIQKGMQQQRLPLSVTYKGRLFEIVRLDKTEIPLRVDFDLGPDQLGDQVEIRLQRVSSVKAYYWMLHRVVWMRHIMPSALRQRLGFWNELKQSFYEGYRVLSSFRYHYPAPSYSQWTQRYWTLQPHHSKALTQFMAKSNRPHCTVIIDSRFATAELTTQTLQSIQAQEGSQVEVVVWQDELPAFQTPYVLYVKAGCVLRSWAVAWFAWKQQQSPKDKAIYSDHDHYTEANQWQRPYFKPTWSLELQRSTGYVGDVVWLETPVFRQQYKTWGNDFSVYAALLNVGLEPDVIGSVPAVLWSAPMREGPLTLSNEQIYRLQQHLNQHQIQAIAEQDQHGLARVRYAVPEPQPLVSIIIPTRDMLHFLQPCVDSILQHTQWQNYEIIIVDNQSRCSQTLAYMQQLAQSDARVKVLKYDDVFNYSAINNYAVQQARGNIICLLNNDTEVISADWLDEMVSRVLQPNVGVVGARLYYTNGQIQHAGDVVGIGGGATHLHGVLEGDDVGYMSRAVAAQDLSAVTAACLVTPKDLYQQLGGLNETQLKVAFNDVDYCLRVRQAGYAVIYTPYAELYHHESVSRGPEDSPEKKARAKAEGEYMRRQWSVVTHGDPYYNPNLNQTKADFSLAKAPSVDWPWN